MNGVRSAANSSLAARPGCCSAQQGVVHAPRCSQQHAASSSFAAHPPKRRRRCSAATAHPDPVLGAINFPDYLPWLVNHPVVTLGVGLALVIAVPRLVKALWKVIVVPIFILAGLYAAFQAPQQVLGTLSTVAGNSLSFAAGHPQLTSLGIIAATAVLLSSSVVPILAAGFVWLLIFAPQQLSRFLPQVPNIPTWVVPAPIKSVRI